MMPRRQFVKLASCAAAWFVAGCVTGNEKGEDEAGAQSVPHDTPPSAARPGRIYKSVKWGMVQVRGSVEAKFRVLKELGYDGVELESPTDLRPDEVRAATAATGLPVHGVVNARHWQIRLSSPDEAVRREGREILAQALRDAHAFGGDSVLLVPGRVEGADETHDDVWQRSIAEIRPVLPVASHLGVRVLIETVWNGFCEQPEQLRDYLDEINSPWVAAYLDLGNVQKFAPTEAWVRTLGARIVKLDIKDWGQQPGFCKIGDGDVNWSDVRTALSDIQFTGWCTAEVAGGGREELADIAARMDRVLGL